MIKKGDIVKIKPEWADPGDEKIRFIVLEDEAKGRVPIQADLDLTYNPIQVVNLEMVDKHISSSSEDAIQQR